MRTTNQLLIKRVRIYDCIVAVIFIMMLITRFSTNAYIAAVSESSKATIENVVQVYEANPMARLLLNMMGVSYMLSVVAMPALVVALYLMFRRKVLHEKMDIDSLGYYVTLMLAVILINMVNDLGNWLGKYIQMMG